MKKFVVFLAIVILIVVGVIYAQSNYQNNEREISKENKFYEEYLNKKINGISLGTVINKAVDSNYKNEVEKDSNGQYLDNGTNSINIDIKMIDNDKTYSMEAIYNGGISEFTSYYGIIDFECKTIEYHKNTGRVKYMLFEQITQ